MNTQDPWAWTQTPTQQMSNVLQIAPQQQAPIGQPRGTAPPSLTQNLTKGLEGVALNGAVDGIFKPATAAPLAGDAYMPAQVGSQVAAGTGLAGDAYMPAAVGADTASGAASVNPLLGGVQGAMNGNYGGAAGGIAGAAAGNMLLPGIGGMAGSMIGNKLGSTVGKGK